MKLNNLHESTINEVNWGHALLATGAMALGGGMHAMGADAQVQNAKVQQATEKVETGLATYYTTASCQREGNSGVKTANGANFDENALTCARRSREFGSKWEVTNLANGKKVIVTQNDYGPGHKPTARGVIIDLTPAAFKALGAGRAGELKVQIRRVL